jgi:phosphatidate cytidylyltransferase
MDERDESEEPQRNTGPRTPAEGVRIIGAEEAQAALEAGQAAGRQPDDAPRYGDVPAAPTGPRPAHRFPLPESVDPSEVARPPIAAPDMQHWSEPATGEVPRVLGGDDEEDLEAWSSFTQRAPRWRDQDSDWEEADFHDTAALSAETSMGALDTDRTEHSDLFQFADPVRPGEAAEAPPERQPVRVGSRAPSPEEAPGGNPGGGGGRDVPVAIGVGLGIAAVALILFKLGPVPALILATAVVALASVEAFDVLHRAGYKPARLLGITGTISIMLAAYNYGETALPLVLGLMTITTFLWFLWPVERARATINVAGTLMGFLWVGFLGSFAGLLLSGHSVALLLGPIIATVAYDVGAYAVGSQFGRRPLAPSISPNKTVEGLVGGASASVAITTLVVGVVPRIHPWNFGRAFWLGVVVAIAAPLGDLCESMVKRDLGVKDMGALLPGHGGVLDRIDALLFALPAAYYLLRILH